MNELDLKKLEDSLPAPWDKRGISAEEYALELTERWHGLNDILNGRRTDTTIVKSTINDTLEFIVWASAKRELISAVSLLKSHITRINHDNQGAKKGATKIR
jgi:hypothetical protein